MVRAYFDTNVFGHIFDRDDGVTDGVVERLASAVRAQALVIPGSVYVAEELLGDALKYPTDAFVLGHLYLSFVEPRSCIKEPKQLIREAILAYISGSGGSVDPLESLSEREWKRWNDLATGNVTRSDIRELRNDADASIESFREFMTDAAGKAHAAYLRHKEDMAAPDVAALWPTLAPHFAEPFAERAGQLDAVKRLGFEGLFAQRIVRAAVGFAVALIQAHSVQGWKPQQGDCRDLLHVVMAAALGGPLITHDRRFARCVTEIPGLDLETLTLPELVTRL